MLVVVFDSDGEADEGRKALLQLDREGRISVKGYAVMAKHPDGSAEAKQGRDAALLGGLVGSELGSLLGLRGGPTGVAIGAVAGFAAGRVTDLNNARIDQDFIDEVTRVLVPNTVAVVAEIEEDRTGPVDDRMEALGGSVFRRALSDVSHTADQQH
jgi:uncharacterized membrane protein